MATVTLNALALQLAAEFGIDTGNSAAITQTERFLNQKWKEMLAFWDWPWRDTVDTTINTVAGTSTYGLSTTACEIRALRMGSTYDKWLEYCPVERLIRYGINLEEPGEPEVWFNAGYDSATQKVQFTTWPVADATYPLIPYITLRGIDLSSGSTVPIPEDFYDILKDGARAMQEKLDKDYAASSIARRDFREALAFKRDNYSMNNAESHVNQYNDVRTTRVPLARFGGNYPY